MGRILRGHASPANGVQADGQWLDQAKFLDG